MNKVEILNEIDLISNELKEVQSKLLKNPSDKELNKRHGVLKVKMDIAHSKWNMGVVGTKFGFDADEFIKEMIQIGGKVLEEPMDYEEFEFYMENEHEQITERELRGDI